MWDADRALRLRSLGFNVRCGGVYLAGNDGNGNDGYWIGLCVSRAAGSRNLAIHVRTLDPGLTALPIRQLTTLPALCVADVAVLIAMPQRPRR